MVITHKASDFGLASMARRLSITHGKNDWNEVFLDKIFISDYQEISKIKVFQS